MNRHASRATLCVALLLCSSFLWQTAPVSAIEPIPDPLPAGCDGTRCVFAVQQSADDAGQTPNTCTNSTTLPEAYFGQCDNTNTITTGFRFSNVNILKGASITKAYLWFVADGPYNTTLSLSINGEQSSNAAVFSASSYPSSRTPLSTSITWTITPPWSSGQRVSSPDIKNVIQQIVGQPGWASGNALALIVKKKNNATGSPLYRRVFGYDRTADPGLGARLVVYLKTPPKSSTAYVTSDWDDIVSYYSVNRTIAFRNGARANPGYGNTVLLAFGHQVGPNDRLINTGLIAGTWGIEVTNDATFYDNAWVIYIAQEFIDGYNFGRFKPDTAHYGAPAVKVAIGTSTDGEHYNGVIWPCSNTNPSLNTSYWQESGVQWGSIINTIQSTRPYPIISGNDIESFDRDSIPHSCASGVNQWFNGFESVTSAKNLNFGDFALGKPGWSPSEPNVTTFFHGVSWTRQSAIIAPQIYCTNMPGPWANFSETNPIYFHGVTSGDGGPAVFSGCTTDGNGNPLSVTFSAGNSWSALYNALNTQNIGTVHKLGNVVLAFRQSIF